MAMSAHLIARFNVAKEEFKNSVCKQVDQLFATFISQMQPGGVKGVQVTLTPRLSIDQPPLTSTATLEAPQFAQIPPGVDTSNHLITPSEVLLVPKTIAEPVKSEPDLNTMASLRNPQQTMTPSLVIPAMPISSPASSYIVSQKSGSPVSALAHSRASIEQPKITKTTSLPVATKTVATKSKPIPPPVPPPHPLVSHQQQYSQSNLQTISLPIVVPITYPPAPSVSNNSNSNESFPAEELKSDSECDCSECDGDETDDQEAVSLTKRRRLLNKQSFRSFSCDQSGCTQSFTRKHQLKEHRQAVHGLSSGSGSGQQSDDSSSQPKGGPHLCRTSGCKKTFQTPCHLHRHELTHTNKRPFKCKWAGCAFVSIQRSDAIRHVRVRHFNLPRTFKQQQEAGIQDDRDPLQFIDIQDHETELLTDDSATQGNIGSIYTTFQNGT